MRHLLICKTGGVLHTRAEAAKASSRGEQGESEAIISHLLERDDVKLIYFGTWRGDVPNGLTLIEPHLDGLDEWTGEAEQEAHWAKDIKTLEAIPDFDPIGFINIAGYAPTMCTVGNPKGVTVQAAGIRYVAPILNVLRTFGMPRIIINNDPRTYPKEQEMTLCWPEVIPAALLDQTDNEVETVIGGKKYLRHSVWARAESWCTHPSHATDKTLMVTCVAHAHIRDGCKQRGRDASWRTILSPVRDVEYLYQQGFRVYGKGWEHYSWCDSELMVGECSPYFVMEVLGRSTCCPAVACAPGFYTGKPYVCIAQDCIPILYGDGVDPFTWDPYEKFLPLDSQWRIHKEGDLCRLVEAYQDPLLYAQHLEMWRELCVPHWELLDECITELVSDADVTSPDWRQRFGGYDAL